ncbi:MAG: phosphoglycerate dehydrogenase [Planctomycetaceae bacterium]|nr:phosphoglycerate dehydrogenase [Planctomycetales bacterium]MCB9922978.1 phosphoglycerate dehydrogenase [Planctomycetaceae bacterium]
MPTCLIVPEAMREVPERYVDVLHEAGFDIVYPKNPELARNRGGEEELIAELEGVDATIAGSEGYTPKVLDAATSLRVIARAGVGYDGVNIPAATQHSIPVTITPTANHEAVAEMTLALMFAASRMIVSNDKLVRAGKWPRRLPMATRGKTIGIFGLGRIGSTMAFRAAGLGMRVLATEKYPNAEFVRSQKIQLVELDELLSESDIISVHAPLTDDTRGLFNAKAFARMKPGSIFLNTARGGLMVEADLYQALESGHLRAAGLDVFEQEPPSADNPLFELDNVVVSPHIAGADETSLVAMGVEAAECIASLFRGIWPEGAVVNDSLKETFRWQH